MSGGELNNKRRKILNGEGVCFGDKHVFAWAVAKNGKEESSNGG
jgi:hypothetical protein